MGKNKICVIGLGCVDISDYWADKVEVMEGYKQ